MKPKKFTFKLHPRQTGLAAIGNSLQDCDVKLSGKVVGIIYAPTWQSKANEYLVRFTVKGGAEGSKIDWKWITLSKRTGSMLEMKEWLNTMFEQIIEKYELVCV